MQRISGTLAALLLVGVGYGLGRCEALAPSLIRAQDSVALSDEATKKISLANDALKAAGETLKTDGLYTPATKSLNPYAILVGGINAVDDLENGRGVDPVTFAALYADEGTEDVKQNLSKDEEGRLLYKNKLVRIYPVSKLKKLASQRMVYTGELKAERPKP